MFTEAEREVAAILLDLPRLFAESEYPFRPRIESSWGAKRRRSADENPLQRRLSLLSSSSSQAPLLVPCPNKTVTTAIVAPTLEPERPTVKVEASSPATPLSFPPSESDERPKRKRKASFKKTREEWLAIIEQYIQSNELLKGEIQKVRGYYDQLKTQNSAIKARNQKLRLDTLKSSLVLDDHVIPSHVSSINVHQQPFIMDRIISNNYSSYSNGYPGLMNNNVISHGVPDLNVSLVESTQHLENKSASRMKAAQARQRRIQICKSKNGLKLRIPYQ